MGDAISALLRDNIILVIDDFHHLTPENRTTFLRNVKEAVFNGLKVLLLSVTPSGGFFLGNVWSPGAVGYNSQPTRDST
jgi:hypothetical protein